MAGMRRRRFLTSAAALVTAPLSGLDVIAAARRSPAMIPRALQEWELPSGVQVGDVTDSRAMIWSAAGREARMRLEIAADERFRSARVTDGPAALEDSGFTAKRDLGELTPGEPVFYRVWFEDLATGAASARIEGRFRTAPRRPRPFTLCWSGDVVGQGWGIDPARGGLRLYETMARHAPDVFVHSGDQIYADNPLRAEVALEDGTTWRNVVTPAKSKVAETLDEFRGNYAYNLLDTHARAFNSQVPMIVQWDDHEVLNNWNPGLDLTSRAAYQEKSIARLAARARRAMFDYLPVRAHVDEPERVYRSYALGPLAEIFVLDQRSYRGANSANRQAAPGPETRMLGAAQIDWFKRALAGSRATWKIIASDMPLGLVIGDGQQDGVPRYEGWANGAGGPLGREHELADLLSFLRAQRLRNLVWITADVHYAAAHRYDPAAAVFRNFDPFWELVAGPLHAGTFGPGTADPTFGCTQVFNSVPAGMPQNRPPSDGFQFFGTLSIDPGTRRMTAALWNLANEKLWSVVLDAERR
jgi:alkaline phosphatase D